MKNFAASCIFLALPFWAGAQDTRTVTEPAIPGSCTTLSAGLASVHKKDLQESDEGRTDTKRIQEALDKCEPGKAVELRANGDKDAFLSGPLDLRSGVTLLIDKDAMLFGSRNPRDYDTSPGSCGVVNENGHGCRAIINGSNANNSGVMGDGVIDGRGGSKLLGQNVSWWDLAQQAKVTNKNQNCPRILILSHCDNFTLYRIALKNSPNFHVSYGQGNGFTAWGVVIDSPKRSRNTDGIDPANSTNVTITHCFIHAGDDNVAIKAGGTVPSTHMSIVHNHFYTGHGMSIGSETDSGASQILVSDLTVDGADNGIRIKSNSSRGGLVEDVVYEHICIRDTKNPIFMDSNYSYYGKERNKLPTFQNITLRDVHISGGGKITLDGYDAKHLLGMTFDNVILSGQPESIVARYADLKFGPGVVNLNPKGEDVTVSGHTDSAASTNSCESKFVPMPGDR